MLLQFILMIGVNSILKNELKNVKIKLPIEIKKNNNLKSNNKYISNLNLNLNININLQEKFNKINTNPTNNNLNNNNTNPKENLRVNNDNKNKKYFFDFDNLIKKNETKDFFNKKIQEIKNKKNIKMFIFLFKDLNSNINKELKINKRNISINTDKDKEINTYINSNIISNSTKFLTKFSTNKNENLNLTYNIKPKILNINSFQSDKGLLKEKIKPLNKNNINFLKEFLIENNLMKKGKSLVLIISLNENFIGIFHHKNESLFNLNFKDEKLIAKNFLRNLLFNKIEYGLDELIEEIDNRLLNKFSLNFVHLIALTFCFFLITVYLLFSYKDIIFNNKKTFKNMKNIEDNIYIIRSITNNSLKKEKRCLFNNDKTCLICLEEIGIFNNKKNTYIDINELNKLNCYEKNICKSKEICNNNNNNIEKNINLLDTNFNSFSYGIYDNCTKDSFQGFNYEFNFNSDNLDNFIDDYNNYNYNYNYNYYIDDFSIEYLGGKINKISYIEKENIKQKQNIKEKEKEKENTFYLANKFSLNLIKYNTDNSNINKLFTIPPPNFYEEKKDENYNNNNNKNNIIDNNNYIQINENQNKKNIYQNYFEEKTYNNIYINSDKKYQNQINQEISIIISNNNNKNNNKINEIENKQNKQISKETNLENIKNKNIENTKFEFEEFEAILDCNHIFHSKCIALWMMRGDFCPICRSKIEKKEQNIIEKNENHLNNNNNTLIVSYVRNTLQENNDSIIII
jgi:hypothetical protein